MKHRYDALPRLSDPAPHKLARQAAVDLQIKWEIASQRMAKPMLVVDAIARCFQRESGQRRERLEIGDEKIGALGKRKLANKVQRLAPPPQVMPETTNRSQRIDSTGARLPKSQPLDVVRLVARAVEQS